MGCSMSSFDIAKFLDLDFKPARYRCLNCLALLMALPCVQDDGSYQCPACSVNYYPRSFPKYLAHQSYESSDLDDFLASKECSLLMDNQLDHAKRMAQVARNFNNRETPPTWPYSTYTPMSALLQAFALAKRCIHFTSFGLSNFMLGVLTVTAQRVPVNGVVALNSAPTAKLLTSARASGDEAGERLNLRALSAEGSSVDLPHQKLVVVDGLLAFKGSANLTEFAWRKAKDGLELIEVVTEIKEVVELNNKYFSPVWLKAAKGREGVSEIIHHSTKHPEGVEVEGIDIDAERRPWQYFDIKLPP